MGGFIIALVSGALMSIQGVFNTGVTKASGVWATNVFVQATALLTCLVIWVITEKVSLIQVIKAEPKYMLLGGIIGAGITFTVIKSMELLGPARAVVLIVISQLIVAYLIEIFGIFGVDKQPFSFRKIVGMVIAIAGVIIFKWKS